MPLLSEVYARRWCASVLDGDRTFVDVYNTSECGRVPVDMGLLFISKRSEFYRMSTASSMKMAPLTRMCELMIRCHSTTIELYYISIRGVHV